MNVQRPYLALATGWAGPTGVEIKRAMAVGALGFLTMFLAACGTDDGDPAATSTQGTTSSSTASGLSSTTATASNTVSVSSNAASTSSNTAASSSSGTGTSGATTRGT